MGTNNKILLIDDEQELVFVTQMSLEAHGYKIITAYDGEAGLSSAQNNLPDLILLDVMMPKMNGYEVCQKLKADDKTRHIPVIILSAKTQDEDMANGKNAGCDDYITKPFELPDLMQKIEGFLVK